MTDNKNVCKETEHNYIKIGERIEQRMAIDWSFYKVKVHTMCCSKCGKVIKVEG